MSESKAPVRPSQVTMAGWLAVVGSALLVLTLFDSMTQIRSTEMREAVDEFLSTTPGSGLGLDAPQVLGILRALLLFSGATAAAAAVLGVYVLRRHQGARIGFTVAAAAIMFTAPVTGSPLAVLVAAAAMMLWTRPARDWFAGREPAPTTSPPTSSPPTTGPTTGAPRSRPPSTGAAAAKEQKGVHVSSENPPPGENPSPDTSGSPERPRMPDSSSDRPVPPPTQGFGNPNVSNPQAPTPSGQQPSPPDPGQDPYGQSPYGQDPYGQSPPAQNQQGQQGQGQPGQPSQAWPQPQYAQQPQPQYSQQYAGPPAYGQPQDPDKRPVTVTVAAWLTWVFSALTLAAFVVVVFVILAARDRLVEGMRSEPQFQQLDVVPDDVIAVLWVLSAICLFWCVASAVLAFLAYHRVSWARIALVVSAAMAALFSLAAVASLVSALNLIAAGATVVLLFTGGANEWYSRKGGGYPSYPQQHDPYAGQHDPYAGQHGTHDQGGQQYGDQQYGGQGQPESGDRQDPPTNVW